MTQTIGIVNLLLLLSWSAIIDSEIKSRNFCLALGFWFLLNYKINEYLKIWNIQCQVVDFIFWELIEFKNVAKDV